MEKIWTLWPKQCTLHVVLHQKPRADEKMWRTNTTPFAWLLLFKHKHKYKQTNTTPFAQWFQISTIPAMCVIERKYPASELKYSNGCQRLGDHHIWNKWIRTNLSERYSNKVKLPVHWSHTIPFRLKHVQQFSLQKHVLKKGFHFSVKKLILFPRPIDHVLH